MKTFRPILLALAVFCFNAADAQRYMMPIVGINMSKITPEFSGESPSVSGLNTPRLGVLWDIEMPEPLPEGFYVRTGMMYNAKGYKIDYSTVIDEVNYNVNGTFRVNYVELPLMAAYRRTLGKINVYGATGPYYAMALLGKQTFKLPGIQYPGTDTDTDIEFYGNNKGNTYKNYEFGWNFGAGVEYKNIQLNLNYALGFTNIANTGNDKAKSGTFSVSLGYLFDLGSSRKKPEPKLEETEPEPEMLIEDAPSESMEIE